jgi:alpha-D-ribose 1-methylphosphonate 5-triphosphate synthase subunit PhnL
LHLDAVATEQGFFKVARDIHAGPAALLAIEYKHLARAQKRVFGRLDIAENVWEMHPATGVSIA